MHTCVKEHVTGQCRMSAAAVSDANQSIISSALILKLAKL